MPPSRCSEWEHSGRDNFRASGLVVSVGPGLAQNVGMITIRELQRLASPAPKPQSLAWDGATLWMGSRETKIIHAINPATWTVGWRITVTSGSTSRVQMVSSKQAKARSSGIRRLSS